MNILIMQLLYRDVKLALGTFIMKVFRFIQAFALALPLVTLSATAAVEETWLESVLGTVTKVDTLTQF